MSGKRSKSGHKPDDWIETIPSAQEYGEDWDANDDADYPPLPPVPLPRFPKGPGILKRGARHVPRDNYFTPTGYVPLALIPVSRERTIRIRFHFTEEQQLRENERGPYRALFQPAIDRKKARRAARKGKRSQHAIQNTLQNFTQESLKNFVDSMRLTAATYRSSTLNWIEDKKDKDPFNFDDDEWGEPPEGWKPGEKWVDGRPPVELQQEQQSKSGKGRGIWVESWKKRQEEKRAEIERLRREFLASINHPVQMGDISGLQRRDGKPKPLPCKDKYPTVLNEF